MGTWKYTAKEKRAIDNAYAVCYRIAETRGREKLLDGCVRIERRERSCGTVARWLVAEQFARGLLANPAASEFAWASVGLQQAVLIGAGCRPSRGAYDPEGSRLAASLDVAFAAARMAQAAYTDRGLDRAASKPISAAVVEIVNEAKPKAKRGAAFRDAIGKSIRLHRDEKGGA
jgi:hypothetical protein